MKRYLLLLSLIGCVSYIPVKQEFPKPPTETVYAANLDTLSYGAKMSDLLKNSTKNYTSYYVLKAKFDAWVEWYDKQSKLK